MLIIWIYLSCQALAGWCQTIDDARALTTDMLVNYSRILRPKRNQSEPVDIQFSMELITIQDFDEVQETLSISAVMVMFWTDDLIVWDPAQYGGIDQVKFESDQVWTPMLALLNNVDKIKKVGFEDNWLMVSYNATGWASFYPGGVLSSKCDVDVTYFPWDRHRCQLLFTTWGFEPEQMTITPLSGEIGSQYYSQNGAWEYISSEISVGNAYTLNVYITLERKPRFVAVNVIIPVVLLAVLSTLVFYIPVDSMERISYSITMLLAIAVFLTLVGDNLPKTSNPMSIFSYYLVSILVLSILITLANMFSVRIYYLDEKEPVGSCWRSFVRCFQCQGKKTRSSQYSANKFLKSDQYQMRQQPMNAQSPYDVRIPRVFINTRENTRRFYTDGKRRKLNLSGNQDGKRLVLNHDRVQIGKRSGLNHPGYRDGKRWELNQAWNPTQYSGRSNPANKHVKLDGDDINALDTGISWKDVSRVVDKVCCITMIVLTFCLSLVFFVVIRTGGTSDM